jgi:hypothetical protein
VLWTSRYPKSMWNSSCSLGALAVHLMTNTAVTGATFEIDGGQQVIEG